MRIAKRISRSGFTSRREAEKLILQGRVKVNNQQISTPAYHVQDHDIILVDDEKIPTISKTSLWLYYKPSGFITSSNDPQKRKTIFDNLPEKCHSLKTIGRLDLNTEGLLLLTNNGDLARYLELPSTGWKRKYRVRVFGKIDLEKLELLKKGLTYKGINYAPVHVIVEDKKNTSSSNQWLLMTLTEGKNREIRNICEAINLKVTRLIRVSYGPFQLGQMKKGDVKQVPYKVIKEQIKGFE